MQIEIDPLQTRADKINAVLKTKRQALKEAQKTEVLNKHGISEDSQFHIKVIEGANMVCEDEDGLADCYVLLKFFDWEDKTPVIKNTNAPQWNTEYWFDVERAGDINLECWDYNKKRPHTLIG